MKKMTKQEFLEYIGHFNSKRFDKVASYFAPDVTVEYPDNFFGAPIAPLTLHGPQEFINNYRALTEHTKEVLEVGDFLAEGNKVFVELYTEFITLKDPPPGSRQGWKKGDIHIMTNWVLYDLDENGKMKRIRIAHFRNHDPKTAKYK
ncbi:MAG: nuclear transport factor 2 family protein [Dehalococcoidales bacterium]|nr:nuclear transport factor 2 family protein [Dehalococcoidales bacterium]